MALKYSSIIFKTIFFVFDINMIAVVGSYLRINRPISISTCPEHVLEFVSLNFCIAIAKTGVVE